SQHSRTQCFTSLSFLLDYLLDRSILEHSVSRHCRSFSTICSIAAFSNTVLHVTVVPSRLFARSQHSRTQCFTSLSFLLDYLLDRSILEHSASRHCGSFSTICSIAAFSNTVLHVTVVPSR